MKRFLVALVAGFLMMELVVRALAPVLGPPLEFDDPLIQAKLVQLERLKAAGETIDVLFVGNSTVVEGVDVQTFEKENCCSLSAYNAGLNGADVRFIRRMLESYLLQRVHPKTVIFGVSTGSLSSGDDGRTLPTEDGWREGLAEWLALYRYRKTLRNPLTVGTLARSIARFKTGEGIVDRQLLDLTAHGDEVLRAESGIEAAAIEIPDVTEVTSPSELHPAAVDELRRMVVLLQDRGISLALVYMPTTAPSAPEIAAVRDAADSVGAQYLNAVPAVKSTEYFVDSIHLNAPGARVTAEFIARRLEPLWRELPSDS